MRSYRLPNRERNVISQTYNDGIVRIYSAEDAADPGHMPEEKLTLKAMLMYAFQFAPPRGGDLINEDWADQSYIFQFAPPRGGDGR